MCQTRQHLEMQDGCLVFCACSIRLSQLGPDSDEISCYIACVCADSHPSRSPFRSAVPIRLLLLPYGIIQVDSLYARERERPRTAIKRRSRGIHLIKTVYEQKRGRWKKWEWLESRRKHTHYDITSVGWKTTGRAADALAISRALFHAIFHRRK